MLDSEGAAAILDYLSMFDYATRKHAVMTLITWGLLRRGGVRAIDIDDCHLGGAEPYLEIRHRPKTDTPLKNKNDGERDIGLKPSTATSYRTTSITAGTTLRTTTAANPY